MRSELEEVGLIECFLSGKLDEEGTNRMEARLLLDSRFAENVAAQQTAYRLVRCYGRQERRARFEGIYRNLMMEVNFSEQVKTIFSFL